MKPFDKKQIFEKFNSHPPASVASLRNFELESDFRLPEAYVQFLQQTNGGEGFVGPNAYVILWRLEELLEMNKASQVAEFAPGLFLFGSDGGGEAFALDTRSNAKPIVSVPFVGMEVNLVRSIAPNFKEFLKELYTS